jgi:Flp pilus assembly protein TadD/uncharacterized coiled-coil DUF342 family protein
VVEAGIESQHGWSILATRVRMKKIGLILLAGFFFAGQLHAQADDPSETFLKAYMTAQQGEKLEHDNQFAAALAKYRFAGSLLDQLRKAHPEWQPAIVEYRGRKVSENILRVQGKVSTQEDLNAAPVPLPEAAPGLIPQPAAPAAPSIEISPRAGAPSKSPPAAVPDDAAIREATRKLQDRVDQLQVDLQKSRTQFTEIEKEKDSLKGRLEESNSKLDKAQGEIEKAKGAEKKVRDQLADAQDSLKKIQSSGETDKDKKAQEALRAEISQLKKALATVEQTRSAAEKERDAANSKASEGEKKIVSMAKERDAAIAQIKGGKEAQERVQALVAENANLTKKLADAEKSVRELSDEKPKKEKELADVRQQIDQLQQQLLASQKQNKEYEARVGDLRTQLDEATKQLEQAKITGVNAEETARLTRENQILRNIVIRERQEEARRDQAKKLMLAEFDKLKIKSDVLNEQIHLLAQPVTKLTDEELALLRQPIVSISDNNPSALNASFTFVKKTSSSGAEKSGSDDDPAPPGSNRATTSTNFHPSVPEDLVGTARDAKENFERGKYRTAEKLYQEILTKSPNNLYSLSNLGVVYFRTGKLKAAELTLKKAIAIAPKDEFTHTTLGIVFYRQAKFDEALNELTRALAINPKSATAHNYLGITASQKGWQEAAEKEMLEAIADNPEYADAHFNLAVIYATATPPAKELAKRHYARATSLGAQPDTSLEKLLR